MNEMSSGQTVKYTPDHLTSLEAGLAPFPGANEWLANLRLTVQRVLPNGRVNVTFTGLEGQPQFRTVSPRVIVPA